MSLRCPRCTSTRIIKRGFTKDRLRQRYRCKACGRNFLTDYVAPPPYGPETDVQILALRQAGKTYREIMDATGAYQLRVEAVIRGVQRKNPHPPCPHCGGKHIHKAGKGKDGKQRYQCKNPVCGKSYLTDYTYNMSSGQNG